MDNLKVIPQVFYDLIARIIPGAIAIWVLTAACNIKSERIVAALLDGFPELQHSAFILIIVFLLSAYLAGHLISTVNDFPPFRWTLSKIFPSFSTILRKIRDGLCTDYLKNEMDRLVKEVVCGDTAPSEARDEKHYKAAVYLWYDLLRVRYPDVGGRLTKLRAEYHMRKRIAEVLFIAMILHILLSIIGVWIGALGVSLNKYTLGISLSGFILSGWGAVRACKTFQRSIINHYILMKKELAVESQIHSSQSAALEDLLQAIGTTRSHMLQSHREIEREKELTQALISELQEQ